MAAERVADKAGKDGTATGNGIGTLAAGAIFFALAFLYFLPALAPGRGIYGTDYLAGSYPFFEFMAERFRSLELPGWVPYVYGGVPLFASPGSGFYPVWLVLALILPIAAIMPVLLALQFGVAGLGTYHLMRELGVRSWAAFVTGLGYQFTGVVMSYVFAGHDGRIIVATLAPLFLFFLHRLVRIGRRSAFVGTAGTLGFSLLSFQIQSNYYLLLAGLAWGIFALVHLGVRGRALAGRLGLGFGAVAAAFLLGAVNFLPFLGYVDASPRGGEEGRGYEYSTSWSMSPAEVSGLAVPELVGVSVVDPESGEALFPAYRGQNPFKYHTEYAGAVVVLLLVLGAWVSRRDRYWWFFVGVAVVALTFSLGGNTPIYRLYYELLPGTRRFRAPSIAFFMVALALTCMAGLTLERLARLRDARTSGSSEAGDHPVARWMAAAAGGLALVLLLVGGSAGGEPGVGLGFARFALFLGGAAALFWFWLSGSLGVRGFWIALAVLLVTDLWIIDRRFFHTVPPPRVWFQPDDVALALRERAGDDRVWVLPVGQRYAGFGNYLMLYDIDLAGGEHPNPLQRWYEYVGAGETSYVDWHNFLGGGMNFLNAANVRWIVSTLALEGVPQLPGLVRAHEGRSALIYENPAALPRAYLVAEARVAPEPDGALTVLADPSFDPAREVVLYREPELELLGGGSPGTAEILEASPSELRLRVRSDRDALLVVADNYYEGWSATVDDAPAPIHRANHTFRAIPIRAGEHDVTLRFRPSGLRIGFGLYAVGLLLLVGHVAGAGVRRLRERSAGP